ncbi:MAG: adenylate kinase family protein [Candidatus Helarchaeota archaeon]
MYSTRVVLAISGTPGTGKTTIATALKSQLSALYFNLTDIAITNGFILEEDFVRNTKVVDIEQLSTYIIDQIKLHQKNLIFEGHYVDIIPDEYITLLIILRTEPTELKHRLKRKGFSPQKIQENVQSEILGTCTSVALETHDPKKLYEIDTTNISVAEALLQIKHLLTNRPHSNIGKINWLQKLTEKELLTFFP